MNNVDIVMRGDYTVDDLIDVLEGNRKYVEALFVYNKIDLVGIEDVDEIARRPLSIPVSVNLKLGFDYLLKCIWDRLGLIRIYTKKRGQEPNFGDPLILTKKRKGCTVEAVCGMVHREFMKEFKYALVWGKSAKFSPQTCGLGLLKRAYAMRRRRDSDLCEQEAERHQERGDGHKEG